MLQTNTTGMCYALPVGVQLTRIHRQLNTYKLGIFFALDVSILILRLLLLPLRFCLQFLYPSVVGLLRQPQPFKSLLGCVGFPVGHDLLISLVGIFFLPASLARGHRGELFLGYVNGERVIIYGDFHADC